MDGWIYGPHTHTLTHRAFKSGCGWVAVCNIFARFILAKMAEKTGIQVIECLLLYQSRRKNSPCTVSASTSSTPHAKVKHLLLQPSVCMEILIVLCILLWLAQRPAMHVSQPLIVPFTAQSVFASVPVLRLICAAVYTCHSTRNFSCSVGRIRTFQPGRRVNEMNAGNAHLIHFLNCKCWINWISYPYYRHSLTWFF